MRWGCSCQVTLCGRGNNLTYTPQSHLTWGMRGRCSHEVTFVCCRGHLDIHVPKVTLHWAQNGNPLLKVDSHGCEVTTLIRCYFNDVQSANDGYLQKIIFIYSFKVTSHPCKIGPSPPPKSPCIHLR